MPMLSGKVLTFGSFLGDLFSHLKKDHGSGGKNDDWGDRGGGKDDDWWDHGGGKDDWRDDWWEDCWGNDDGHTDSKKIWEKYYKW